MCSRRKCGIVVLLAFLVSLPVEIMGSRQRTNQTVEDDQRSSALNADNPKVIVQLTHGNVSSKSCPLNSDFCSPWVYCNNGKCQCGEVPNHILQCHLQANLSLLDSNCLTYNEDKHLAEVGRCIFTSINTISPYTILPRSLSELDTFMCGEEFNRTGTLCGKCKDDHYPLVYSFDMNCIRCPNGKANWWKYVLAAYFPLTIFYLVVLLFKINVAYLQACIHLLSMLKLTSCLHSHKWTHSIDVPKAPENGSNSREVDGNALWSMESGFLPLL